jgi:MYXO-CTERM domain-containing protein
VTHDALQSSLANPPDNTGNGPFDAFITVFDPDGGLLYGTYLGGHGDDRAYGIALDAAGHAHIAGFTSSTDLVTVDALRGQHDESLGLDHYQGNGDYFLADMTIDGGLDFLSYIGGSGAENNIPPFSGVTAVDSFGATYFVGSSASTDFPVTDHAFQEKNNAPAAVWNMVVVKIMPTPPPCTLTSLNPNSGPSTGASVDAQGSNISAQSELDFGGVPSFVISATPSQLQVSVGPHACETVDVTLICPGSPLFTLRDGFTFEGCPDAGPPDAGPVTDAGPPENASSGSSCGCGCGSTGSPLGAAWILGMSLLAMARRRRQRRDP